ncbi:MAG: zf-HC2 domain-containing protein [Candidatus Omnitrophota bacterium]
MKCHESKRLLADYIDGILVPEQRAKVEAHVAGCKACRGELEFLKAYAREMGGLEKVKAPADFLVKVHERLERRSEFEGIMRRLFVPVRIKVPLELAAVIAVIFIVVLVQKKGPSAIEIAKAPAKAVQAETPRAVAAGAPAVKPTAKPAVAKSAGPSKIEPAAVIRLALLIPVVPDAGSAFESAGQAPPRPAGIAATAGIASVQSRGLKPAGTATRPLPGPQKGSAQEVWDAFFAIRDSVYTFRGRVVSVKYDKEANTPEALILEIPSQRLSAFVGSLDKYGIVKGAFDADRAGTAETVTLELTFKSS